MATDIFRCPTKTSLNLVMTAEEARAQVASEGLAFVTSSTARSGFHNVMFDSRKTFPWDVYGGKHKTEYLGSFATA